MTVQLGAFLRTTLPLGLDAFAWTKPADAIIKSHRRMLKRISTAVC